MPPKKRSHEHLQSAAISNGGGGLVTMSCLTLTTPWTVACQTLSMGFSRQEYWSGLPFPSPATSNSLPLKTL